MTENDDSFHPQGPEWESKMEELLEETEYDTELGMEIARDAQRLVAGELTEAEFHERYHDAVVEEFGVDDRPVDPADEEHAGIIELLTGRESGPGLIEGLMEIDEDADVPRREVMKKTGAGAAFFGLAGFSVSGNAGDDGTTVAADSDDEEENTQWGMVIDLEKCDGCLTCVTACTEENKTSAGANWMYVLTYQDPDQETDNYLVRPCQHCSDAPCEKVCPTTARYTRGKDGIVLTDYDVCIGCRYCQVACPYGVNYFQWDEPDVPQEELDPAHVYDEQGNWVDNRPPQGVMGKCTMCPSRQDGNWGDEKIGTAACAEACDMDVIHFGDMNDPESDPQQYLDRVKEENPNDQDDFPSRPNDTVSTFRLLEEYGTDPNVVYIGNEPSEGAEQIEGPHTYENIGRVDRRKDVLDEETIGGDPT